MLVSIARLLGVFGLWSIAHLILTKTTPAEKMVDAAQGECPN